MKGSAWLLAGEPTDDGGEHPSSRSGVGTATRTDDQGAYRKTLEVVETFGEPVIFEAFPARSMRM